MTFITAVFAHFVYSFLEIKRSLFVAVVYILCCVLLIVNIFSKNLFLGHVSLIFKNSNIFKPAWWVYPPGPLLIFYIFFIYFGVFSYLFIKLLCARKTADFIKRKQIDWFTVAMILGVYGGGTSYLPCFGINFYPVFNFTVPVYVLIIAYAIIRHKFLDIEVIIKKTLVFAGLFTFVYAVFAGIAYISQTLFQDIIGMSRWIAMIPSVLIVIFALKPLERFLINITDTFLFQKKYDYKELLKTFTQEILTIIDLEKLKKLTIDKLTDTIKITSCSVTLIDEDKDISDKIDPSKKVTIGPELAIPLTLNNNPIGILRLGRKRSDQDYTQDDLDILLPLSRTLAIAISNAKLFDELARTQAEIAQKEKMATIGTLAAGMAHEIRNPITTIRTFADYLPERVGDGAFMDKFSRIIPNEIDRVAKIAKLLLEFSTREENSKGEEVVIDKVIRDILPQFADQCRDAGVRISLETDGGAVISANSNQIAEALYNIIKYVINETDAESRVLIRTAASGASDAPGGTVNIIIEDSGLVISEYVIKDVFDQSAEMGRTKRGFGFLLFLARQLVEKNGGELSISSDPGGGGTEIRLDFTKASARPS